MADFTDAQLMLLASVLIGGKEALQSVEIDLFSGELRTALIVLRDGIDGKGTIDDSREPLCRFLASIGIVWFYKKQTAWEAVMEALKAQLLDRKLDEIRDVQGFAHQRLGKMLQILNSIDAETLE